MTKRARIKLALKQANKTIADSIDRTNKYSSGLAYESFNGGYCAALRDVLLLTESDVIPRTHGWWEVPQKTISDKSSRPAKDGL